MAAGYVDLRPTGTRVRATIVADFDFLVSSENYEDAEDEVRKLFDEHYDEIAKSMYFSDGIQSMEIVDVKPV